MKRDLGFLPLWMVGAVVFCIVLCCTYHHYLGTAVQAAEKQPNSKEQPPAPAPGNGQFYTTSDKIESVTAEQARVSLQILYQAASLAPLPRVAEQGKLSDAIVDEAARRLDIIIKNMERIEKETEEKAQAGQCPAGSHKPGAAGATPAPATKTLDESTRTE